MPTTFFSFHLVFSFYTQGVNLVDPDMIDRFKAAYPYNAKEAQLHLLMGPHAAEHAADLLQSPAKPTPKRKRSKRMLTKAGANDMESVDEAAAGPSASVELAAPTGGGGELQDLRQLLSRQSSAS